jgi:hypothetical protein
MPRRDFDKRDDKTRILMNIIDALESTRILCHREEDRDTIVGRRRVIVGYKGRIAAQFIPFRTFGGSPADTLPPEGTIVKCRTNPNHAWGISRFVKMHDEPGGFGEQVPLLREIGGERLLRMYNEGFDVLIGMREHELLEGWERQMYLWAIKALNPRWNKRADDFDFRFRGASVRDGKLTIEVGPHIFVDTVRRDDGRQYRYRHREFVIPVTPKTRLKDIVQALWDANFDAKWADDELEFDAELTRATTKPTTPASGKEQHCG